MSVYVVTKQYAVLMYEAPDGKTAWICKDESSGYRRIYYPNCSCTNDQIRSISHSGNHETLIANVSVSNIVSIGFQRPFVIEAYRMLTDSERRKVNRLSEWLESRRSKGYLPKKLDPSPLRLIIGGKQS